MSIDIVILDGNGNPDIFIEMKHHSANQGDTNKLIIGMQNDWGKIIYKDKKIVIGLYTSVEYVAPKLPKLNFYSFLRAYGTKNQKNAEVNFTRAASEQIINKANYQSFELFEGGSRYKVDGRISYLMVWQVGPNPAGITPNQAGITPNQKKPDPLGVITSPPHPLRYS